jgi:starch synthase (maltosyl-transferring)
MVKQDGRIRVVIEGVSPLIDGGAYPIKRCVGETVRVEADAFVDGHDLVTAVLIYRHESSASWKTVSMSPLGNDRWAAEFTVSKLGKYYYTVRAWIDGYSSWRRGLLKKFDAGQDVSVDILIGAKLIGEAAARAVGQDAENLNQSAITLGSSLAVEEKIELLLDEDLFALIQRYPDTRFAAQFPKEPAVAVDRKKARFSSWYEMFLRSGSGNGLHATFKDCQERLPYIASMGFDVLYLPPIHPIGITHRKGRNNSTPAEPGDVGSPWAIGAATGGHTEVHPELGTVEDFNRFCRKAQEYGIEIALDIAFQCSPDHPFVKEHPEWFLWRPDGTVQYAENPPKKYEDIYPLNFESDHWQELWHALRDVVLFWIAQGVKIFRVDNPHTKPFGFWQWLIEEIKKEHPEVFFLAEAFTRPKVMNRLAKLGFAQSYTYFTWRNSKHELTRYFTEFTGTDLLHYFGPNLWPNTPDILPEYLQIGGRPAFMARLVLAATLGASYGLYGPAFELCDSRPCELGAEEYLNSEKYEIKCWDISQQDSLKELISLVNRIRRENPALQQSFNLLFHPVDNEQIICYSKNAGDNTVVVVVNLDPHHIQSGWLELPIETMGIDEKRPFQMHDLLSDERYLWQGARNFIELDPQTIPAQVFRVRRKLKTERDFDYYM